MNSVTYEKSEYFYSNHRMPCDKNIKLKLGGPISGTTVPHTWMVIAKELKVHDSRNIFYGPIYRYVQEDLGIRDLS